MKLLIVGFCLSLLVSWVAWRYQALTFSGAIAAAICGGLIFGLGGTGWALLLLVFFISSSLLSRLFVQKKANTYEKYAKGSRRDWGQVIANGGFGTLLVIFHSLYPGQAWPWIAYGGAIAAVNADTWATELGPLNRTPPRLITTGKAVEPGTSGAISPVGSLAALSGAVLLAIAAVAVSKTNSIGHLFLAVILGGCFGAFVDSFLGATVQAIYYCPACNKETEGHPVHSCGTETTPRRGWVWMDNDLVNFICSVAGGIFALGVWVLLSA